MSQAAPVTTPPHLLLVDDEPDMLEALADTLGAAGIQVVTAGDAQAALAHLRANPNITAMVTDLRLPGMDGLTLLRQAMTERQDDTVALEAVVITGHAALAAATQAMRDGAVDFLTKPFGTAEIINAARMAMDRATQRRARACRQQRQALALASAEADTAALRERLTALLAGNGMVAPGHSTDRATVLAHALRTPLVPVLGYAELLQQPDLPAEEVHNFAQAIAEGARGLLTNINRLLDFDALQRPDAEVRPQALAAQSVLTQALTEQVDAAAMRQLTLLQFLPQAFTLQADPTLLALALRELLDNAVQASPAGGAVTLGATQQAGHVLLTVTDQGPGLPEALLTATHLPFATTEPVNLRHSTRLSLGLAMADRIAHLHGGALLLRRPEAGGTEATLRLPA